MTSQGVGYMCRIDSRMDAELHTSILQDGFLEFYGLDKADLIFKQDNDPKYTPQKASKWLKQNNINVLKGHAQSPDLNSTEICSNTSSDSVLGTEPHQGE